MVPSASHPNLDVSYVTSHLHSTKKERKKERKSKEDSVADVVYQSPKEIDEMSIWAPMPYLTRLW